MYKFRCSIHALPSDATAGPTVRIGDRDWPTLAFPPTSLATPFPVGFEVVQAQLADLPRMFIEPDGSFVWVGQDEAENWQLDGVIYDRHDRVIHVQASGSCPQEKFDQFLRILGWPNHPFIFQLLLESVYVDEATFRETAASAPKLTEHP